MQCAVLENIHTPHGRFFGLSPVHFSGNSSLVSYFLSKILVYETPQCLEFLTNDLPREGGGGDREGRKDIFWNAQSGVCSKNTVLL